MTSNDEDSKESFAKLIGDVRPLKESAERVQPPMPTTPKLQRDLDAPREGSASSNRFRWPDEMERRYAATAGITDQQLIDLARGYPEPEERIDLHGLRRDAAPRLLARRFESAVARKLRCVLVIHGQGKGNAGGEAILRDRLPEWLTRSPGSKCVLAFAPAPARLGDGGATLVLLKKSR